MAASSPSTALNVLGLPSVAVTHILSYLPWEDKLSVSQVALPWKDGLHTVEAWNLTVYGNELDENAYFIKDKRLRFLLCIKHYGRWFKSLKLMFGFKIGHIGLKILHAVPEFCTILKSFYVAQELRDQTHCDYFWKKSIVASITTIVQNCSLMQVFGIIQPVIDWTESAENNIMTSLIADGLAYRVSHLELTPLSLFNHEGILGTITNFKGLRNLVICREKVNNKLLLSLVDSGLKELTLVQEEEIPFQEQNDLMEDFWRKVLSKCPDFRIHLIMRYIMVIKDVFPAKMPLRSLILDDLVNIVTKGVLDHISDLYKDTLEKFTYTNFLLENFETGDRRLPVGLIFMAKNCTKLKCLEYGFPLSSAAILVIAKTRQLRKFVIPAVEVSYQFDLPEEWFSQEELAWLQQAGRSEGCLEREVSGLLGFPWNLHEKNLSLDDHIATVMCSKLGVNEIFSL